MSDGRPGGMLGPVSDLSYRNYDGPLASPTFRWWVIAKDAIIRAAKLPSLRLVAGLSAWYYVMMIIILFIFQELAAASPGGQDAFKAFLDRIVWKDQFVYGFSYAQHLLLVVTLIIGAGAIANDNRANALLVYLSKPCTRLDYMIGKWVGLFVPILVVITLPTIAFYGYGLFSFREQGFFRDDPWLLLRILSVLPLSAALHTSLILAFSSMFKQGRIAGAVYAGTYFLSFFFTVLMQAMWMMTDIKRIALVKILFYCSIDGLQIGLAKAILQPSGSMAFGLPPRPNSPPVIPPPAFWPCLGMVGFVTIVCMAFVWSRVRAVEVVG